MLALAGTTPLAQQKQDGFRFKSGVELINVTATVTDRSGRFYGRLRQEDFVVYEDNKPVEVTHFSAERTPVSLGIVVDTSGSMVGEKWSAAVNAIDRFFRMMNDELDEFFLYRFSANADLVADWTDRSRSPGQRAGPHSSERRHGDVRRRRRSRADGAERPEPQEGGRDHFRRQRHQQPRRRVGSEAGGARDRSAGLCGRHRRPGAADVPAADAADSDSRSRGCRFRSRSRRRTWRRGRIPMPGGYPPSGGGGGGGTYSVGGADDRVNVMALREMTDDSGGRTEIVRDSRDLDPAVASIADELSQQYYLGYPSPGYKDGRWHTIRVEVRDPSLKVRARKGYIATP